MQLRTSVETTARDVRYALRALRSSPGFTAIALSLLALGIGANAAIFSVVSAVLLRPLPFPEPDRVVFLWADLSAVGGPERLEVAPADYVAWNQRNRSFSGMAAFSMENYNLTGAGRPEKISGVRAAGSFFTVLGMQPILGRSLTVADDQPDAPAVAVLDERVWRSSFAGDAAVVGRTIYLNGVPRTVVGVDHSVAFVTE